MALRFLNREVSDLCLGKPELKWVAATATISDAVSALKSTGDTHISVWVCGGGDRANSSCVCVGKFCMTDVILFLCREENLGDPFKALEAPVYDILPKGLPIVRHLEPNSSLLEAIDYILEGTQNVAIPIQNHSINNSRKWFVNSGGHSGRKCCWLTQEDVVRFLLNSVGSFSPIPTFDVESLNLIDRDVMTITYGKPASSALAYFQRALTEQKSVAVVDEDNRLIGEISPSTLARCDETAASAIMALSAMDLMTYIDCGGPPEKLVQLVKVRLEERNIGGLADMMEELFQASSSSSSSSSCCSSDDESGSGRNVWASRGRESGRYNVARRCEAIVCSPGSSLVAVMIQALAHRVTCVWVVEQDRTLVGIITLAGILNVFRSSIGGMHTTKS